jgi:hypothetical protein
MPMNKPARAFSSCLLTAILVQAAAAGEEVRVTTRDELVQALRQAKPGTTILVAPGKYRGGVSPPQLMGTTDQPIVVAGQDASDPPVIEGGASGLHFSSPTHLELRNLVIVGAEGNGLNIDDAGAIDTPSHDLILRDLVVRDVGPRGNRDGIKLSGVRDFRIENCRIERWGSSGSAIDMVGCHRGTVCRCRFLDARGDGANGVQAKGGSSQIVVRRCRFERAGGRGVNVGGSTGLPYFRPRDASYEAKDITVEDCVFVGGMAAVAFVGVDGALVQHNTIYCPERWPLRILQENADDRFVACRNGRFEKNIVVFRAADVREVVNVGGNTAPETFTFSGNVWHCLDRPQDLRRRVRLPVPESGGTYDRKPSFNDVEEGDFGIRDRQREDAGVRDTEPAE